MSGSFYLVRSRAKRLIASTFDVLIALLALGNLMIGSPNAVLRIILAPADQSPHGVRSMPKKHQQL